jgi:hypothetical protein
MKIKNQLLKHYVFAHMHNGGFVGYGLEDGIAKASKTAGATAER